MLTRVAEVNGTAQLVSLWLHDKAAKTQSRYSSEIRRFAAFVSQIPYEQVTLNELDLPSITLNDLQDYEDYLVHRQLSDYTRNTRLATVKSLLSFGHEIGYLSFNAGKRVKLHQVRNRLNERILSEHEVSQMLSMTPPGRDLLLLKFLYLTGARVGEVGVEGITLDGVRYETEGLRWRDLRVSTDGNGLVTFYGKRRKTRTVAFPRELYLQLEAIRTNKEPSQAVFPSRQGGAKPLSARRMRQIVKSAARRAGIEKNVSCHWLRHAHGTHALSKGAPLQLIKESLGHESLETTSKYLHVRPEDGSGLYLS